MDQSTIIYLVIILLGVALVIWKVVLPLLRNRSSVQALGPVRSTQPHMPAPVAINPKDREEKLRTKLNQASDRDECRAVYESAPSGSQLEEDAIAKFYAMAQSDLDDVTTFDDCLELLNDLPLQNSDEFESADGLIEKVVEKAAELAEDYEEAERLFDCLNDEFSDFDLDAQREVAFKRLLSFCNAVNQAEVFWDNEGVDSDFGRLAILRAAELINEGRPYEEE